MSFAPQRIQYPFAALTNEQQLRILGRNIPLIKRISVQEQWNTFERIENYNDIMYQKYELGNRGEVYYQYASNKEMNDYRAGQLLHMQAYSTLPIRTFQPIRDRPMPDVPVRGIIPIETNLPRFVLNRPVPTASEKLLADADMTVYTYVSTFNMTHHLKYSFVDDLEKNAYERAEVRVNIIPTLPPPI